MARQPRSQRPEPARAPHEELSRTETADEHDDLHGHPVVPTDPASAFTEYATDLAERYDAPAADVEEGLRRLAATFLGERAGDAPALADALRRPPLTLLADALAVGDAIRLIREADLADLDRRVRMTAWLASPDTPLLSHEELGHALASLALDLRADRAHLVKTGLPSRPYAVAPWLYHKLGRLYPTRQAASFVPYAERFTNARPGAPPYTWVQTPHRGVAGGGEFRECEYEQADFLAGVSPADGLRVEGDRERLLGAKLSILALLARASAEGRAESLWDEILVVLTDTFSAPEAAFYVGLDGGARTPNPTDPLRASDPRSPGGLTDWLEVAGHVEQELTLGTLAAARSALTARGVARLSDLTNQGVPPGQLYFHFRGVPEQNALDAAIDAAMTRGTSAEKFWVGFRERAATAFQREFNTPLVIPVVNAHAQTIGPIMESYIVYAQQALARGHWITTPPAGLNVFQRDGSSWTVVFDGVLRGKPDAVGLYYIRLLLERPGRELDVRVLRQSRALWEANQTRSSRELLEQAIREVAGADGVGGSPADDLGEMTDERAVAEYTSKADELDAQIRAAEASENRTEVDRLREHRQQLNDQLESARGLGGRGRRMASQAKKDRDAVVKAINEAVEGFRGSLPALYEHMSRALHVGATCSYRPAAPINWQL